MKKEKDLTTVNLAHTFTLMKENYETFEISGYGYFCINCNAPISTSVYYPCYNCGITDEEVMKDSDLTIEPYPPRKIGGQHVGLGPTGVKITHNPTNLQVIVGCERSQMKNKKVALSMIEWGLTEIDWKD